MKHCGASESVSASISQRRIEEGSADFVSTKDKYNPTNIPGLMTSPVPAVSAVPAVRAYLPPKQGGWSPFPQLQMQTNLFKNSVLNGALYENPEYHLEEWSPSDEYIGLAKRKTEELTQSVSLKRRMSHRAPYVPEMLNTSFTVSKTPVCYDRNVIFLPYPYSFYINS